jgi:hypothetical protein
VPASYFSDTEKREWDKQRTYLVGYITTITSNGSEYKNKQYGITQISPMNQMIWSITDGFYPDDLSYMSKLQKDHPLDYSNGFKYIEYNYRSVNEALSAMATYKKLPFDPTPTKEGYVKRYNWFMLQHVSSDPKWIELAIVKP